MKQLKVKPSNNEDKYEKFENRAWLMYDVEFSKQKKERKSVSNNKENSMKFLQNQKKKNDYSSERNNKEKSSSLLGKIGNNIINQVGNKQVTNQIKNQNNDKNNEIINKLNKKNISNLNNYNYDKKSYDTAETNTKLNYNSQPIKKDITTINNKNMFNSNNIYKNENESNNNEVVETPGNANTVSLIDNNEVIMIHLNFIEILLDLDIALENKTLLATMINRLYKDCELEFIQNLRTLEIFNISNVNRVYVKSFKIILILITMIKYILLEFPNYDMTLKSQLKKIINSHIEILGILYEIFVIDNLSSEISQKKSSVMEKLKKIVKSLNIPSLKQSKMKNNHEVLFHTSKLLDSLITTIKNLLNCYFNFGFYVPIYNSTFELVKQIDKLTFTKIFEIIQETSLFYLIKKDEIIKRIVSTDELILNNPLALLSANLPTPYLPPLDESTHNYSLVLDLDETLVHFFYTPSGGIFLLRPGALDFLKELSSLYEIIIFTAAMKEYADNILDIMDPFNKIIKYRLYRQHTTLVGLGIAKNLANIGRNLDKIIIIDNLPENFKLQPNNGIGIKTWLDDINDTQLIDLMKILKDIVNYKVSDVRNVIKKINDEMENLKMKNPVNPFAEISIQQLI